MKLTRFSAVTVATAVLVAGGIRAAQSANTEDLGTLGGSYSFGYAVNSHGAVTGGAYNATDTAYTAFVHDGTGMRDLGTVAGPYSLGMDINNNGVVVGLSTHEPDDLGAQYPKAFIHDGTSMRALDLGGRTSDLPWSRTDPLNEAGQVIGTSATADGRQFGFIYDGSATHALSLGGDASATHDLSETGYVTGWAFVPGNAHQRAYLWNGTSTVDLGALDGGTSIGEAVNDHGHVVGVSSVGGNYHAVRWANGGMQDLGTLGGDGSYAQDINNHGQIVGQSQRADGSYQAFVWENGVMRDLGLDGAWSAALEINENGVVYGQTRTADGQTRNFLYHDGTLCVLDLPQAWVNRTREVLSESGHIAGYSYDENWLATAFVWDGTRFETMNLGGDHSWAMDVNNGFVTGYAMVPGNSSYHAFRYGGGPGDEVAPVTSAAVSPAANAAGWHNGPVTVTLTATDDASGVGATYYRVDGGSAETYGGPFVVSGDAIHSVEYYSVDAAGNTEAVQSLAIKIDGTAPTVSFGAVSPAASAGGWHNTSATIAYTTSDNLSGVVSASPAGPLSFTAEGANQTRTVTVTDAAGNSATFTSPAVNIDNGGPTVTASVNPAEIWPANGRLVTVTVTGKVTDAGSGHASAGSFAVTDEYGQLQPGGTFSVAANGTYTFTIQLEARRNGQDKDGRRYSITVKGADLAGNTGSTTATSVVLHDQRK